MIFSKKIENQKFDHHETGQKSIPRGVTTHFRNGFFEF